MAAISACGGRAYLAGSPAGHDFIARGVNLDEGPIGVKVAVPDAGETEALTGLPLYEQGIQPVWLEVTNNSADRVRVTLTSVDPNYYSPHEIAWMNRRGYDGDGKEKMERWLYDNAMPRRIPPGATRSGFVYTHLTPGTKGVNVDVVSADLQSYNFTAFVPMPGFTADYMQVDFDGLYEPEDILTVTTDGLRDRINGQTCCGTDETGTKRGDPFNVVIVASPLALRRALLRAGWLETEAGSAETAVARLQRYRGRGPDGTFTKARADGSERKEVRLWLTPAVADGLPVWLAQVLYNFGEAGDRYGGERVDPNIDEARNYFLQDLWYAQSVRQGALTRSFEAVPPSSPVNTFTGSSYYSDGFCAVLWLSETPIALDDVQTLGWWYEEHAR